MTEEFQDFCITQVRRLAVLSYYPKGDAPEDRVARGELVKALLRNSVGEDHARRIVDRLLETRREVPTPVDVATAAGSMPLVVPVPGNRNECQLCGGTGWQIVEYHNYRSSVGHEYGILTGAEPCQCRQGGGIQ